MSIKCPSCGFDAPDAAPYCDLCKQPFRKPSAAPAAPRASDDFKKLTEGLPEDILAKLPPELLVAKEKKVPAVDPTTRYLAWGFFGFWLVAGFILAGIWMARYQAKQDTGGTTIITTEP